MRATRISFLPELTVFPAFINTFPPGTARCQLRIGKEVRVGLCMSIKVHSEISKYIRRVLSVLGSAKKRETCRHINKYYMKYLTFARNKLRAIFRTLARHLKHMNISMLIF